MYIKIHTPIPSPPLPPKVTANLKTCKNIQSKTTKKKTNQILPATIEKFEFCLLEKTASCSFIFLLVSCKCWNKKPHDQADKELQWQNVKQKPFRET